MKKITFLFFLALVVMKSYGQCIKPTQYTTTVSNNLGLPQLMSNCGFTSNNYLLLQNLIVGESYIFTNTLSTNNTVLKYITVTDLNNVVIDHGFSPLTVTANTTSVRVHISDDENCGGSTACHNVSVQAVLNCPVPTAVTIEDVITDSASFSWQLGGAESAWEVIALPSTSGAPANDLTEGVTLVTNAPNFLASLLPGSTYKFYYRAVCSETEKSPWNSSVEFTTLCEAVTYFTQGFDMSATMPNCYAKVGTVGSATVQSSSTSASLPNNFYLGSGGMVSLPPVSNYSDETHRIKFKLRGAYTAGGVVDFGYLTSPLDASTFVPIGTFTATSATVYDDYIFAPGSAAASGNFAFRNLVSNNNAVVIDDITWEPIPSCDEITLLKTQSFTSTTAVVSWTANSASSEVVYGVAATAVNPNTLTAQATEESSFTFSNLQANTAYKVWVRSVCGDNAYGSWIGPLTITTTCAPVTTFSENFNASSSIPACFKRVGTGGNASVQSSAFNISSYEDGNAGNAMSYGMLSLPAISNAAEGTNRLKFTIKSPNSVGGTIEIGYLTNPGNPTTFNALQAFTSTSTAAQIKIYIPAAGAIPVEVLAFRHTGNPSSAVQIDDIVWETAPLCGDVTAIQASEISHASAKISWTGTTETNWQVAYGATTVTDPGTLLAVDVSADSNTVLTTLSGATTYKVWVRSNCNNLGFGAWIGPIQFTTACDPVTAFSQDFNASTAVPGCWTLTGGFVHVNSTNQNGVYMSALNVLATPQVSNASTGTHRLKFKAKAMYNLGGTVQVGYMTSYNNVSTFVSLQSFTPTSTTVYDEFFATLGTLPTTGYLAFRHSGASFNPISIDDVVWEPLPTCEDVSEPVTGIITNTTAPVSWTAEYSTNWEVVYTDLADTSLPSALTAAAVTETQFTISNLTPDAPYKFWVRTVCGNGVYSSWIGPIEFKTTCDPVVDLPWVQDFDGTSAPNLPECWTKENGNWILVDQSVPVFAPFVPTNANSGTNYLRVYNNAVDNYMWTPGFALEANAIYDYSTFVQGDGYDGWKVEMVYNRTPKAQGAVQFGDVYEIPAGTLGQQPYTEMRNTFVPSVSGTYFFAVRVNENSTSNPYFIAFDDFTFEEKSLSNPGFEVNTIKAYPNPVKDILYVSYAKTITNVAVFNLLGQQVITKEFNSDKGELNMSALSAGTYLVKLISDNQVKTIKIIKE